MLYDNLLGKGGAHGHDDVDGQAEEVHGDGGGGCDQVQGGHDEGDADGGGHERDSVIGEGSAHEHVGRGWGGVQDGEHDGGHDQCDGQGVDVDGRAEGAHGGENGRVHEGQGEGDVDGGGHGMNDVLGGRGAHDVGGQAEDVHGGKVAGYMGTRVRELQITNIRGEL